MNISLIPMLALAWAIEWLLFYNFIYPFFWHKPRLIVELKDFEINFPNAQNIITKTLRNTPQGDRYICESEWHFDLVIINNSEFNAFHIKLLQSNDLHLEFREKISFNRALKAHNELVLPFKISKKGDIPSINLEEYLKKIPRSFQFLEIVLEYKNPKGKKFYSKYSFKTNKTEFKRFNQKELDTKWSWTKA